MNASIVLLPGDGIGPEVTAEAHRVLDAIGSRFGHQFAIEGHPIGGEAIDLMGAALPRATLRACNSADAVLLGAVGGERWSARAQLRPEAGLLELRARLGVFANIRPVTGQFVIVRELSSGVYGRSPRGRERVSDHVRAYDTMAYADFEIRRVAHVAFQLASSRAGRLTSVDKANVLESSRLWREVIDEVSVEYPGVRLEHALVDSTAMRIATAPEDFDVIVTGNLFGDILSDLAGAVCGSLGSLPSAAIGRTRPFLFEPVHGSAPDIAGLGVANPHGAILSAALLLREGLGLRVEATAVEDAVARTTTQGLVTADLGGELGTRAVGEAICAALADEGSRTVC